MPFMTRDTTVTFNAPVNITMNIVAPASARDGRQEEDGHSQPLVPPEMIIDLISAAGKIALDQISP